jgi:hypothetical protein
VLCPGQKEQFKKITCNILCTAFTYYMENPFSVLKVVGGELSRWLLFIGHLVDCYHHHSLPAVRASISHYMENLAEIPTEK